MHSLISLPLVFSIFFNFSSGKFDEVELYYERALDIYMSGLGQDDPNVMKTLNHLAAAYLKQEKYTKAEQLYKEVLEQAHDNEFGEEGGTSEKIKGDVDTAHSTGQGRWHKVLPKDCPTVVATLKVSNSFSHSLWPFFECGL
jgi:kinesin light chain